MEKIITSAGIQSIVEIRQYLTNNHYGIKKLKRLYSFKHMSDYVKQDAVLGGYVPHKKNPTKKHLRKELYFIYG